MNAYEFIASSVVYRLGWTLLHSAWQGAAVAAMLAVALGLLARRSAQARYLAACIAMTTMLAAGVVTFLMVRPPLTSVAMPAKTAETAQSPGARDLPGNLSAKEPGVSPLSPEPPLLPRASRDDAKTTPVTRGDSVRPASAHRTEPAPAVPAADALPKQFARLAEPCLPWLVAAWLAGVGVLGLWRTGGLIAAWRLTKIGTQPTTRSIEELAERLTRKLGVHRAVRVVQSLIVETPMVIGWLRPVILLPLSAVTGLSGSQLEAILAHELAHIRRHDYLFNLLQSVVETLLFYHPAVWWISRRLRMERERCCDDVAVQLCGDRIGYAEALAAVETTRAATFAAVAAGSSGGKDLIDRVGRVLGAADHARHPLVPSRLAALAVAVFVVGSVSMSVLAQNRNRATVHEVTPLKEASEKQTEKPQLPPQAQAELDQLNFKPANSAEWRAAIDMIERPETRPPNTVVPGECNAFVQDCKSRLAGMGVTVKWNAKLRRYEVAHVRKMETLKQPRDRQADLPDATLTACLRHAVLVAVGEVASNPAALASGKKSVEWGRFDFKITEVLKGKPPAKTVIPARIARLSGKIVHKGAKNEPVGPAPGERLILFLNPANKWLGSGEQPWDGAFLGADVQPATSEMIAKVKKLIATTPEPLSGADQLARLVKKYLPGYKLESVDTLTTPDGKQEINLTAARNEWRGTETTAPTGPLKLPGTIWRNRTLTELVSTLKLKVESAAVAEDVARLVQGLFKSPALLEDWTVKAEPMEGGWRVTPTYDGPPAQVMAQYPIELIMEDGVLKDVRENPGFWPPARNIDRNTGPLQQTVEKYAARIRSLLPKGWSLQSNQNVLKVIRDEPVESYPTPDHPPAFSDEGEWKANVFVQRTAYAIELTFGEPYSSEKLANLRRQNERNTAELAKLVADKMKPFLEKHPAVQIAPGEYRTRTGQEAQEEQALLKQYFDLRAAIVRLPDVNNADACIFVDIPPKATIAFFDRDVEKECNRVVESVVKELSSRADPAKAKPQPDKRTEDVLGKEFKWNPDKKAFELVAEAAAKPAGKDTQSTATSDAIDRLVADLSASHGLWVNGLSPNLDLPDNAPPERVIERYLAMTGFDKGHVTSYRIIDVRQVRIPGPLPNTYTAALLQTNLGEKILIFQKPGPRGQWWSKGFDANKTYYRVSPSPATEALDPAEVRRKIAALAVPDETLPEDQRAVNWLKARRERIVPQLIAALDDKNAKVAEQCMDILWWVPASKELTDALVAKAHEANGPLRYKILRKLEQSPADPRAMPRTHPTGTERNPQLEQSPADPRVMQLLDVASTEAKTFPEPVARARWAALAGRKDRAVEILKPLFDKPDETRWETTEGIRLLGEIGTPAGIALLERIASGNHWALASEAYKALAKADPKGHGLTKDQATLLDQWRSFKEDNEHLSQRMAALAKTLRTKETRPLVMQMLGDVSGYGGQLPALFILTEWKDKDALPQIRELMRNGRPLVQPEAVAAYLSIANDTQADGDVMSLFKEDETSSNGGPSGPLVTPQFRPFKDDEAILRGIVAAAIPAERKVAMLRADAVTQKNLLGAFRAVQHEWYRRDGDQDVAKVLLLLMEKETELGVLGGYCQIAAVDSQKRFANQVRRAMKLLADDPSAMVDANVGFSILNAVAAYDLKDLAPDVKKLIGSANPTIRRAAQATAAKLGIAGAVADLYAQLHSDNAGVRQQAAAALLGIKPSDEAERAAREEAVLLCVGKPAEDYALRVLVTYGREKSVKVLKSILDDANIQRAIYAAWVLAQLPDKEAATQGMRRLAIVAMFHHYVYQQGGGIDFDIAPNLRFHQVTQRLNPDPRAYAAGEGPVRIPGDLLKLFDWDEAEQRFAVRYYPLANRFVPGYMAAGHFLDIGGPSFISAGEPLKLNRTHLPLLKEIAAHDSHIGRVMVQGNAVAHFIYRRLAAQKIAAITGEKTTYPGLAGETIPSDAFPQPYKDQGKLLAKIVLDRIGQWNFRGKSATGPDWQEGEAVRYMLNHFRDLFGPQVDDIIREQIQQRDIDPQWLGVPDRR